MSRSRCLTPAQAAEVRAMIAGLRAELDDLRARVSAVEKASAARRRTRPMAA